MTKKVIIDGGKREEIVAAALELFFENGYESTSIRMIQEKVNSSVGLFYCYYKSKDNVFEEAIKLFFKKYEGEMQEIIDNGKNDVNHLLKRYIDYVDFATQDFREKYLKKLHWSILGAIREYTVRIMRNFVYQILEIYIERGIIERQERSLEVIANLITFAVGGSILYQNKQSYDTQKTDIFASVAALIGTTEF